MSNKFKAMKVFSLRLKELRIASNYTQQHMAEMLGIRQQSYARYESNLGEPNLETIIKLCDIFEVSSDYLLGIADF